jgi:hypothetical protein
MKWLSVFFLSLCFATFAQLPDTDIWMFKLKSEKGKLILGEGKNITSRKGYDNQPFITPDGKSILYISIREDSQSDVYKYDLEKNTSTQFTFTKESEYSPIYTPDQKNISCVVVEADSTQRLWLYNLDGSQNRCYNTGIDSIGYSTWLSKDTLLYYKLTMPHSLRMYCDISKEDKWICNDPTRAFKKTEGPNFIYGIKVDSAHIQYRIYNNLIRKSDSYCVYQGMGEDFIWHNNYGLVKSEGNKLFWYNAADKKWDLLFDFTASGIKKITRFAFDPKNKFIVIVDNL